MMIMSNTTIITTIIVIIATIDIIIIITIIITIIVTVMVLYFQSKSSSHSLLFTYNIPVHSPLSPLKLLQEVSPGTLLALQVHPGMINPPLARLGHSSLPALLVLR